MKKVILIGCLIITSILVYAEGEPSGLFDALQKQIESNTNKDSQQKDYLLFLDADGNNLETSITNFGTEWLEENIDDLVPLRDELRTLLGDYNERPCVNMNNEKVQHYIMVVDVAPALFTRITGDPNTQEPHYLGKSPANYFSMSVTEDITYNSLLNDAKTQAIQNFKATFDKSKLTIADQNANLYVSIFVMDRKIEFGKIKELVFTYDDVYKEMSSSDFIEIINTELKPKVDGLPKIGFSFLNQFVQQFISVFHGSTPYISTNCADVGSMGFESGLGSNFFNFYCDFNNGFDIEATHFKEIIYRSAKYLDYLHVYFTIATSNNNQVMIDYLGEDFLTDWDAMLRNFVETYYNSGMDQKFAIYFKSNYRDMFNNYKNDPDYKLVKFDLMYIEIFFKPENLTGEEQYNKVECDMFCMTNALPTEYLLISDHLFPHKEYLTNRGAEEITQRLYEIVTQAYDVKSAQLFTDTDRNNIYNLLISNEKLLWDYYLNPSSTGLPGLGIKATQLAEKIGFFMNTLEPIFIGVDESDWKEYLQSGVPYVLTGFTQTFINAANASDDLNLLYDISATYIPSSVPDGDASLNFNIKTASKFSWTYYSGAWRWIPILDENAYQFSLEGDDAVEFFNPVGNLRINTPTYYKNCTNCKQKLTYEYAFVTATRIREKTLDDKINNAILAVEILSLPFAFAEYAAAQGMLRIVRGLLLAVDLEAVGIAVIGGGNFEEGCNKVFGPSLGPVIFPYLNTMNTVVGLGQLTEVIGTGGYKVLKAFSQDELLQAAAASSYLTKTEELLGNSNNIIELEQYNEIKTVRSQIKTNLGINNAGNASQLIDNVEDVFIGFEAGGGPSTLRSNEKFEELMIKYQYWKKDFSPQQALENEIIHANEFLEGLNTAERNILDAMLSDELGNLIIDSFESFDVVKNSHKMKALKKLAKNNVCQF